MKRSRFSRRAKQSPDADLLVRLATEHSQSSSRLEDEFWETRLAKIVDRLLAEQDETSITTALDQLYSTGNRGYDHLIDLVEYCVETRRGEADGGLDAVLIAVPLLAWSRFQIPAGPIASPALAALRVHLQAHMLAADARLCLADYLFSPDQLPQSYVETSQIADKLVKAAIHGRDHHIDTTQLADTVHFLSDTRYLMGAVAIARGAPLFRWQEEDGHREEAMRQWRTQGSEVLRPLLPACAMELLPPAAYHVSIRDADRASRPYSLQAAMAFLQTVLNKVAGDFRAVIAPYYDHQIEEYRIGFILKGNGEVVHGVVWPLLDGEDENAETASQIEAILRETGLTDIVVLEHRLPLEYCDDCGAPLYPNAEGEPIHAELPEEPSESAPRHLH